MHFVVIQHLNIEPPALIAETIEAAGHQITTVHLDQGDWLPDSLTGTDGIIIMGGPQSANDDTDYIRKELVWVKHALEMGVPMLGICLGAQIMAKASGAEVYTSPVRELGWHPVYHTIESTNDPLFSDMPEGLGVFQWHGETFEIPEQMTLIASHPDVPAQAFRLAQAQYGLQFHVEITETIIESWIAHCESERNHLGIDGVSLIHKEKALHLEAMHSFCRHLVLGWLNEIRSLKRVKP